MAWSSVSSFSSTSFGSIISPKKYDVFLSFRGEDTRNNFTSHLHAALTRSKIRTYIDHNLERGAEISDKLLKAIEGSKLAIIIFSKNYATSSWCLDELVKIIECKEANGQILLPIFYHTDPSDVRYQTGSYATAFAKHEQHFGHSMEKLRGWRVALTKAASLSGWHTLDFRQEAELVERVAAEVCLRLQSEQLDEDIPSPSWKSRFEKTINIIKQHTTGSLSMKLRKGQAPSVDGNMEYKLYSSRDK